MKIAAFLLIIAIQVSAKGVSQITLSVKNAPLVKIFKAIENQSDYVFFYDYALLQKAKSVTITANNIALTEVLNACFKDQPLTYSIVGKTIIVKHKEEIKAINPLVFNTNIDVSGTITDVVTGKPLAGATVKVKGSNKVTITDDNGNFTLDVPGAGNVLVISYVGYETMEVRISKAGPLTLALKQKESKTEEIIVVGYSTQRKVDLTGSVSQVSAKDFDKSPVTDALQALQGKVAGVEITSNSGQPGVAASIRIRGVQSLNASIDPLYVIDGIITSDISSVNPGDIESISVLKDAASCAIYGSRAANGVVIITTKRGSKSGVTNITFHTYSGIQSESNLKLKMLNATQWMQLDKEAWQNSGSYDQSPYWDLNTNAPADLSYYDGVNTDWLKVISQKGNMKYYDLSASGGSEKSTFFTSVSYMNQKGMIIGTSADRLSFRLNSDHKINNFIEFGNSLNIYNNNSSGYPDITGIPGAAFANPWDPYIRALRENPLTRAYESDGAYGYVRNYPIEGGNLPPQVVVHEFTNDNKTYGVLGNVYVKVKILDGLTFNPRVSIDYNNLTNTQFSPAIQLENIEGSAQNSIAKYNSYDLHWISDYMLNYDKSFNKVHNVSAMVLYSQEEQKFEDLQGLRYGTPNNTIRYLNAGEVTGASNFGGYTDWSVVSYVGRLNYNYDGRYYVQGTIRRDGSSRFIGKNRWGVFPSFSMGWRISKEKFYKNIAGVMNNLKIRASFGALGNSNVGNYPAYAALTLRNYSLNETLFPSYTLSNAVNPDIKWETTRKNNIGIDASFFNSKINLSADYFISHTTDLLHSRVLPVSAGRTSDPVINSGKIENKGFEIELGLQGRKGDLSYNIATNYSMVRNKVLDLGGQTLPIEQGLKVGLPMYSFVGFRSKGIMKSQEMVDKYPHKDGAVPGDLWLEDIDGYDANGNLTGKPDGKIDYADRTFIGNRYPNYTYGLAGTVSYKGFALQVALMGVHGVDLYTRGQSVSWLLYPLNNDTRILDRWDATKNPNGNMPRITKDDAASNISDMSSLWLSDASFLRINNVNLSYTIPTGISNKLKMKMLEFYVSAQNLYTFTKFPGQEVDVTDNGEFGSPTSKIPQPRTLLMGIKATF